MSPSWPKGSEWRKWDLHLHPPETKKNDGYAPPESDVWEEYCRILEESDVWAFGITDYFSADGFIKTRTEFQKRHPNSRKLLLPNIELCLNVSVNKDDDYVNIHVIFNPSTTDVELQNFLRHLQTIRTDNGRPIHACDLQSQADYNAATTTHQYIDHAIRQTFGPADRLDRLLIVAAVNNDGIRPKAGVAKRQAASQELDKFSDALFGNSKDAAYYLKQDRWDGVTNAPAKPVVGGCDAHSFADLIDWLGKTVFRDGQIFKQTTWIKADVNYEGLKQIVFEPSRVFIGEEPALMERMRNKPRRFVKSIFLDQGAGYDGRFGTWFKNKRIELNPELVAIIGNKGSGKSALTDVLGLLGNSHKQRIVKGNSFEELFSFLNKDKFLKQNCASSFRSELSWLAGDPESRLLSLVCDTNRPETIEYLPQKYLEKICANIEDSEFRGKLNEVIFGYVKQNETYGTSTLEELIAYLTNQAKENIRQASVGLRECNQEIVKRERKLTGAHTKDIETRIAGLEIDLKAHASSPPPKVDKPPEDDPNAAAIIQQCEAIEQNIEVLKAQRTRLAQEQMTLTKQAGDLEQAKQAIERQVIDLQAMEARYKSLLEGVGLKFDDVVKVSFNATALNEALHGMHDRLTAIRPSLTTLDDLKVLELTDTPEKLAKELPDAQAASLEWQAHLLEERRSELIDGLTKADREYQTYLVLEQQWKDQALRLEGAPENPAEGTLNWLREERHRIANVYPEQLRTWRATRVEASKKIHELKKQLLIFLNTVKESIDREIASHGKELRDYNIAIESDLKLSSSFVEDFLHYISQNRKGTFHGTEDGKAELQRLIEPVADWQEEADVFSALQGIVDSLDYDMRHEPDADGKREPCDIFDQLKQGKDPVAFYDFLFGFSYLDPIYDLKVDGKTLIELSPGERGGVLLVFYLMLDKRDIPLVIDQPEDNLDNKSVFEILVKFLKEAKNRRQIIIATHNPNLAVVADAEQIIKVTIDKKEGKNVFGFHAGGIEDPSINRAVVDILEGTLPAFDNRRLKYRRQSG